MQDDGFCLVAPIMCANCKAQIQGGWDLLRMLVCGAFLYVLRMLVFARRGPMICACDVETFIGFDARPTRMGPCTRRANLGGERRVYWMAVISVVIYRWYISLKCGERMSIPRLASWDGLISRKEDGPLKEGPAPAAGVLNVARRVLLCSR